MIPNKILINLEYLKLASGPFPPSHLPSPLNSKWERTFISPFVVLPVSAHIEKVENTGKSQTKGAV